MATEAISLRWKQQYLYAVLETNSSKLPGRIAKAYAAVRDRMQALPSNSPCDERMDLEFALRVLQILEKMTSETLKAD